MFTISQITKIAFTGIDKMPLKNGGYSKLSAKGKVFYHFLNEGEIDDEVVNQFIEKFKPSTQDVISYSKEELNAVILNFEYELLDWRIIGEYSDEKITTCKCDCVFIAKTHFNNLYSIVCIKIKQNKKKSTTKISLIVHVYNREDVRDEKFSSIGDGVYKLQFFDL